MRIRPRIRTVSVHSGAYATVRAIYEAQRIYGKNVTVSGIIAESNGGSRYVYKVVERRG